MIKILQNLVEKLTSSSTTSHEHTWTPGILLRDYPAMIVSVENGEKFLDRNLNLVLRKVSGMLEIKIVRIRCFISPR